MDFLANSVINHDKCRKYTQFHVLGYSAFKEIIIYVLNLKSNVRKRTTTKNSMEFLREKSGDLIRMTLFLLYKLFALDNFT